MLGEAIDRLSGQGDSSASFHDRQRAGFTREPALTERPVPSDDLCVELHLAVERAALRSAGSINALQLAVRRFTVALRDKGAQPEDVLIAIKSVINSQTFSVVDVREALRPNQLPAQISTWSIEEFFNEKQA